MRHLLFAAALVPIPMLTLSAPARAVEYPWCSAESINCFYSTFEQCQAAISGLGLDCTPQPTPSCGERRCQRKHRSPGAEIWTQPGDAMKGSMSARRCGDSRA